MNIFCIGMSHHTAPVEVRERFAGHNETAERLRKAGCAEALLLTTCNRVEIYAAADRRISTEEIAVSLTRDGVVTGEHHESPPFYRYEDDKCAQHLFRVTSGLDSMVVGETEILGQVKKAYEEARSLGAVGSYLHRLFQRSFRVAKHVRTHTDITRGLVSVGSVAVDLAHRIFGKLDDRKVLVLGAGETSEKTARALVSRGVADLRVSNRSSERAEDLVRLVGGRAIPFKEWQDQCREVDILITSTSSETPLLNRGNLEPMLKDRLDRPLFIIDIAVPRDVDAGVNEMEGVYLYDVDSLRSIAEQSLALRRQQIVVAEGIVAEHVSDFAARIGLGTSSGQASYEHPTLGEQPLPASEL